MNVVTFQLLRRAVATGVVAAAVLLPPHGLAKTTGVNDDPALQSGPCYQALVDKNAANPTTAPNRELGSACEAEHGDVDKAWARVIRLWGSDSVDLPDYGSYVPANAPVDGATPRWLGLAGLVLIYAVLGTPMRSAAALLGAARSVAFGAGVDTVVSLVLRGAIVAVLIALFGVPYAAALDCLAVLALILASFRRRTAPVAPPAREVVARALARHLAEAVNDAGGALASLVGLALFVKHDPVLFAAALVFAVVASARPVRAARRAMRAAPFGRPAAAALLAAAVGDLMIATPPLSGWVAGVPGTSIAGPVALALLTLAIGWRLGLPVAAQAEQ
jgi:hypothetical protein